MQIPFLAISYGDFATTKKLFSYERDGVHSLPIFTDTTSAILFIRGMQKVLKGYGDERRLTTQLCTEQKHALDIFMTICSLAPDLHQVIIDAEPPEDPDVESMHSTTTESIESIESIIEDMLVQSGKQTKSDPLS